jgi:NUMOD3 motif/LAGLIDADG endonuclease
MDSEIVNDNRKHLERYKEFPPHPSYVAGFIDGDGTIYIRKINKGYQSGISISQCRTNVLQVLQNHFGGSINATGNRNDNTVNKMNERGYYDKSNRRNQFNLVVRSNEYMLLMNYVKDSLIHKKHKIDSLYEFYKLVDIPNKEKDKRILYDNHSNIPHTYNFHCINIEYISGLFDAEGCVYINKTCKSAYISIVQKSNVDLLHHICSFLGYGNVRNYSYYITSKSDCLQFIAQVIENTIVKYNQLGAMKTFLTTDDQLVKEQMYRICNKEKHQTEVFDNLNQTHENKDGYHYTMRMRYLKELVCREIRRRRVYEEKSENMKGENNHNFGKTFSEETRKKMSNSIRNAKGGVSDEIIIRVRNLIQQGNTNAKIQGMLGLSRDIVYKIKSNRLVCRTEDKPIPVEKLKHEVNTSRRKIFVNEILCVIDDVLKSVQPSTILRNLVVKRQEQCLPNTLTIDIIKNIKRDIVRNKVPFYPEELGEDIYNKYKLLINDYCKV